MLPIRVDDQHTTSRTGYIDIPLLIHGHAVAPRVEEDTTATQVAVRLEVVRHDDRLICPIRVGHVEDGLVG